MDGYSLSRQWFDFAFENPEKMSPDHTAIFMLAVEMWNRLGQKEKFGFPCYSNMEVLGIKNYRTYKKYFDDLVKWKFIRVVQESKNQYTANVIALVKNTQANTKALDKANAKHYIGTATIDKQINKGTKNKEYKEKIVSEEFAKQVVTDVIVGPLEKAITDFEQMRKDQKDPMNDRAKELLRGKLEKYDEDTQIEMLHNAIIAGWKSVYPLKIPQKGKKIEEYQKPDARENFEFFSEKDKGKYKEAVTS